MRRGFPALCALAFLLHANAQTLIPFRSDDVRFSLRFSGEKKRAVFDYPGRWDLSRSTSLRFDLNCADPSALLEGTLYLRSGSGWYSKAYTLDRPGPHRLFLPLSSFAREGQPAGWQNIDLIRFAFWPRQEGSCTVVPLTLDARADNVHLLDSQSAMRSADDSYRCRDARERLSALLQNLGVSHGIVTEADLARLPTPKVLILPYNPGLSAGTLAALDEQMRKGAGLLVFGSDSAALATRMGLRLGALQSSETLGRYAAWRWIPPEESGVPRRIFQHAWSFHRVEAAKRDVQVLATWEGGDGRPLAWPSVLRSPQGVWLAHAWTAGDRRAKEQALAYLLGLLAPSTLRDASNHSLRQHDPTAFQLRYGPISSTHRVSTALMRLLQTRREEAHSAIKATEFPRAWRAARVLPELLTRARAAAEAPWRPKLAGIWEQNGTGFRVGAWDETCAAVKAAGFTAVFPNMMSAGRAHYPTKLLPGSKTLKVHGDQLQAFCSAAARHGLERHIWKICWQLNTADPAFEKELARQGRLMQDADGKNLPWLAISHPENVKAEIAVLIEVMRRYPIEGLHLDYMRYPGPQADYGPAARRAFEASLGRPVSNWPADALPGAALGTQFLRFRQNELHAAMRSISRAVKAENPRIKLSVAVWGSYPDCSISMAQDWPVWAREGLVDYLMPMNYYANRYQIADWLDRQRALPGVRERLIPGVGAISTAAELSADDVLLQIGMIRQRGLGGYMLYRLDPSQSRELFPLLGR